MTLTEVASRFHSTVGLKLLSVHAAIFCFDGNANYTNPNGLKLDFEDDVALALHGAPDGFSLLISDQPLDALDMGDAGKVAIESLSKMPIWSRVIGSRLSKAVLYADQMQRKPFGVHMEFEGAAVGIWNIGDDLYIYDAPPAEALSEEPHVAVEIA